MGTRLLVGRKLFIAESLVLSLLVGLLNELGNEVLDHFFDFFERIVSNPHCEGRENAAVDPGCLTLEVLCFSIATQKLCCQSSHYLDVTNECQTLNIQDKVRTEASKTEAYRRWKPMFHLS